MLTEVNLPNVIANGGIVIGSLTLAGWLLRKWMNDIENKHNQSVIAVNGVALSAAASVAQVARDTASAVAMVAKETAAAVSQVARDTADAVARVSKDSRNETIRLTSEIKEGININRAEYIRVSAEIKGSVDLLAALQREANGRTGTIEGVVKAMDATCVERSKAFYEKARKTDT